MSELKRDFSKGKMNKDLDDRIVPRGQYRDANNIDIFGSEGSDVGTAQNIKGNTKRNTMAGERSYSEYLIPDTSTCVGTVSSPNTDKIYYFISAGESNITGASLSTKKDYIMEYNPILKKHKHVFVDIYEVNVATSASSNVQPFITIPDLDSGFENRTGVRSGMIVTGVLNGTSYGAAHGITVSGISISDTPDHFDIKMIKDGLDFQPAAGSAEGDKVRFSSTGRVLNFNQKTLITGINILDDFIYWTDDETEPKKINITRSISGTGGREYLSGGGFDKGDGSNFPGILPFKGDTQFFHTRLVGVDGVLTKGQGIYRSPKRAVWVEERHITVLKKGPTQPVKLQLYKNTIPRIKDNSIIENPSSGYIASLNLFESNGSTQFTVGHVIQNLSFLNQMDFRIGDVLKLNVASHASASEDFVESDEYALRVEVLPLINSTGPFDNPNSLTGTYSVKILAIKTNLPTSATHFTAKLEQGDSLFEFKFPRFSYRYKYIDGEYSTFAPWSQVAFLTGGYEFSASLGFNHGMSNQVRNMVIKGYHAGDLRMMEDVVEIDILYKETNNPTVYTLRTIKPNDKHPAWPVPGGLDGYNAARGSIEITTDLIHAIVPSNQLIRPWDNVPRKARSQEISANRLIYGNYLQNYDVPLQPKILASYNSPPSALADPSVKTMRDYTLGVVFSDKYGRETPVLSSGDNNNGVRIPKSSSTTRNRIEVTLADDVVIPEWVEYMSYYIKEPTVEYYNLILDRWYTAQDGNLWLSFPSSERNKISEDDFLILKKKNGINVDVQGTNKYKVIAIEEDAPEFIKSSRVQIGSRYVVIGSGGNIGNSEGGYPIEDNNFFTMASAQVYSELGEEWDGNAVAGLSVRFKGGSHRSKFYEVAKTSVAAATTTFQLKGVFGPDIGFATNNTGLFDNHIYALTVEFYEVEIENLPEFDGRFFIKVKRDAEIDKYIIPLGTEVFVTNTWPVAYINNNGYQHQVIGQQMPDAPKQINFFSADNDLENWTGNWANHIAGPKIPYYYDQELHHHPTEHQYHRNNNGAGGTGSTNESAYLFGGGELNGIFVNPTGGNGSAFYHGDPIRWISDDSNWTWFDNPDDGIFQGVDGEDQPEGTAHITGQQFWKEFSKKHQFFIDGATAASWTSWIPNKGAGSNSVFENTYANNKELAADWYGEEAPYHFGDSVSMYNHSSETDTTDYMTGQVTDDSARNHWTVYNPDGQSEYSLGPDDYGYVPAWIDGTTPNPAYTSTINYRPPWDMRSEWEWTLPNEAASENFQIVPSMVIEDGFVAANMKAQKGLPSRAIRDAFFYENGVGYEGSFMDISWTTMGAGPFDDNITGMVALEDFSVGQVVSEVTSEAAPDGEPSYNDAKLFIEKLVEPGTRWRFQNDPDETIYTTRDYSNTDEGYHNSVFWKTGTNKYLGAFGIRNFLSDKWEGDGEYFPTETELGNNNVGDVYIFSNYKMFRSYNMRQRWSLVTVPKIGSGPNGYNPIFGTLPPTEGGPDYLSNKYVRALHHDGSNNDVIEMLEVFNSDGSNFTSSGAVFETQPRESVDLDIYYQASGLIPIHLTDRTNEEFIPVGSTFILGSRTENTGGRVHTVTSWSHSDTMLFEPNWQENSEGGSAAHDGIPNDTVITFNTHNHNSVTAVLNSNLFPAITEGNISTPVGTLTIHGKKTTFPGNIYDPKALISQTHTLGWNNCWGFGNGVESDRIRDDYNAPQMDNGVKASSTIAEQIKEERRKHGLIWSGIYNSTAGVNETNQFIAGEKITKDLNPIHGSIQALHNRDTQLIMFCEDKILRAVTNKDALYNADGKPQLISSNTVIGDATPYQGDFGISTNPESLVVTPYEIYFTDAVRGHVLRLTTEGIVSISDKGMKDHFGDAFSSKVWRSLGTHDALRKEYNLSILTKTHPSEIPYTGTTISYSELSKGWCSFKSFIPQHGISINNGYYTFYNGHIWEHHSNPLYNYFYDEQFTSDITLVFNDKPATVKSFGSISYEGSQAKISAFTATDSVNMLNGVWGTGDGIVSTDNVKDGEYFNLTEAKGWQVDSIITDQQSCSDIEFKEKEGKWFGYPSGDTTSLLNLDEQEFTVQGLGMASFAHDTPSLGETITIKIENKPTIGYAGDDGTGEVWDSQAD